MIVANQHFFVGTFHSNSALLTMEVVIGSHACLSIWYSRKSSAVVDSKYGGNSASKYKGFIIDKLPINLTHLIPSITASCVFLFVTVVRYRAS